MRIHKIPQIKGEKETTNILDALSHPFRQRKGGVHVEFIISFLASIMANIVSYYVCKWLDGGDSDN